MKEQLNQLLVHVLSLLEELQQYVYQPWFAYQILAIAAIYGAALLISWRIAPKLEARARAIKGNPRLLRIIIPLLRRVKWILFILFLAFVLYFMRSLTWPSRSYLVHLALSFSLAWLTISLLSLVIRSRTIRRYAAIGCWLYAVLVMLNLTSEAASILDDAGITIGNLRISALLLLKAIVFLTLTLWFSITAGNFLDRRIRRSDELTPSLRVLIGKLLKIGLIVIATVVTLSAIGFDLTVFAVFSGALGVGIGFGLQKVVSNFISGIIILMDRSIKPGDTISLGETFGWIRELRARFISVVTRDGREYLIPNEDFITREVINWSFSDDLVRLDVPFGVSYQSDPHVVSALAIAAAQSVPRVVKTQQPVCWMTGFGDSSLNFVMRFWISDPQKGLTNIRGIVLLALWDTFKEHNIGIPYPHREIIMKTPVELKEKRGSHQDGEGSHALDPVSTPDSFRPAE